MEKSENQGEYFFSLQNEKGKKTYDVKLSMCKYFHILMQHISNNVFDLWELKIFGGVWISETF